MGYESYVTGGMKIVPALTDAQIKAWDLDPETGQSDLHAHTGGEEDTVGVVNGTIAVIPGSAFTWVECRIEERYKAYDLGDWVGKFARHLHDAGGFTVTGALYVDGEDAQDFSRYRIDENGDARHEEPEFLWPNGDKGWG
jgi:hypothetical protein